MDGNPTSRQWLGHLVPPCLIGFALSIYGAATLEQWRTVLHPSQCLVHTVLLAMLLALVVGLRFPRLLRALFSRESGRERERVRAGDVSWRADPAQADHLRVVGSGCLLLAGAALLALRPLAPGLARGYDQALMHFHWTPLTLWGLEMLLLLAYMAAPLVCLGIALNCAKRLALLQSQRLMVGPATLCAGVTGGLVVAPEILLWPSSLITLAIALCLMAAAIVGMRPVRAVQRGARLGEGPMLESRGRRVLGLTLWVVGFLAMLQMLSWQQLASTLGLWRCGACVAAAASVGLLAGALPGERWMPGTRQLAMLALAVSVSLGVVLCSIDLAARLEVLPQWGRVLAGVIILTPSCVTGFLLAALGDAYIERADRRASAQLSACAWVVLGLISALVLAIAGLQEILRPFESFALLALAWLTIASVLVLVDAVLGLRAGRAQLLLTLLTLGVFTALLPRQRASWERLWGEVVCQSMGELRTVASDIEADALIEQLFAGRTTPREASAAGQARLTSMDTLLRRLALRREPYAAVTLRFRTAQGPILTQPMLKALTRAIHARLRPDGAFVLTFGDPTGPRVEALRWRQRVEQLFPRSTRLPGDHGETWVAFRGTHPAIASASIAARK